MKSPQEPDLQSVVASGKPRPLRKWLYIGLATLLIAGGVFYYRAKHPADEGGPTYVTRPLSRGGISIEVTATGNLKPTNQVTVGSELSGTAAEVYVDTNDPVKKGQPIAKLDTAKLTQQTERTRASLLSAQAGVSQAEATLRESEASYARFQELHEISGGKTPSKADMQTALSTRDRAQADLESARASVAEAEADLKSNERDLSKAIIRSPVDGVILTRSLEVGQTVAASFSAPELFIIAEDLRKMQLVVSVAEADIGRLKDGQTATFTVDAWPARTYTASVKKVTFGSVVTNNVVTYDTELEVVNEDLSLRPGMTATADIYVEKKDDILTVSNAALRFDPNAAVSAKKEPEKTLVQSLAPGPPRRGMGSTRPQRGPKEAETVITSGKPASIWTLREGKPAEVKVTIGVTDGSHTEVIGDGLTEGMPIIISATPPAEK